MNKSSGGVWARVIVIAALLCVSLIDLRAADAPSLFDRKNVAALWIVPYDAKKRGPEERAQMLQELGLTKLAYDWRAEHVSTFNAEIEAMQKHGIEISAWWYPGRKTEILDAIKRHGIHPQLWVCGSRAITVTNDAERIEAEAARIRPIAEDAVALGCKVGLYNHREPWFEDQDHQIAIIERLKRDGITNVGIVFNFHHWRGSLAEFPALFKRMQPYLIAVNLNGMKADTTQYPGVRTIGADESELAMIRVVEASGWRGPVGIIHERGNLDAALGLAGNLSGLAWIQKELRQPGSGGPKPQEPTAPANLPPKTAPVPGKSAGGVPSLSPEYGKALKGGMVAEGGAPFEQWPLTIEVRAKLDGKAGYNILVASSEKAASAHWEIYTHAKRGALSVYLPGRGGDFDTGVDICDGQWHDILVSLSDEAVKVWLDGKWILERKPPAAGKDHPAQQRKIGLGRLVEGTIGCDGVIDDVRISRGANEPTTWIKGSRKRMDITLGLWSFDELGEAKVGPKAPPMAPFKPALAPLRPEDNLTSGHFVNRDRVFDFYAKQAIEAMGKKPTPEILAVYPGLDGGNQGHWGNQNDAVTWKDDRWDKAERGNLFSGVFRGADIVVVKGVCVRKGNASACFDPLKLSFPVRWTGDFIRLGAGRHGFSDSAKMAGKLTKKEVSAVPKGEWKYHGFYRHGDDVIFSYSKDGKEWLAGAFVGEQEPAKLAHLTKGGPSQWPAWLEVKGSLGTQKPFATDTLLPPTKNPYGTLFFLTGMDFFKDGSAAVCTMTGEVWLVKGLDEKLDHVRWKRFATGLHHALGVKIIDDKLYVLGRDQITRLHDLNGDDEADFYECVNNAMTTSPGGHDFIVGLDADAQGRFYTSSGNQGILRLSQPNKVEVLATGLRNPNGLSVTPDGRFVLSNGQEGNWTPASAVFQVDASLNAGTHFGAGGPKAGVTTTLPILQLPRGEDNSCGGQVFLSDKNWPSLKGDGNFLHFSFGTGSAWLVSRQLLEGVWQSAAVKLTGNFVTGPQHGRFAPHDGHLYVSGMIGWGSYTPEDGAIHRVRHVGGDFPTLIGHEARDNGVLLRFDRPLDAAIASKASAHFAQCWNYLYGPAYGSPEYSVKYPESPGHDALAVKSAQVLDGGKTLFLEIPQLVPASQIHLRVGVTADRAQDVFLTAHHLGQPFVGFPGYVAVPKDKTHEHAAPIATGKANPVKWEIEMCRGPVREMKLQTGNALQYAQKELRAKAGEGIALLFENPDIMPHNFVLVARGAEEKVGELSAKMVADPDGYARHYVPETADVLCYSRMLDPGQKTTVYFNAPKEPGRYTYLCSFPGHSQLMRGVLVVE
ncbi:MAG: plastocyanin/azurin family copper-binding protein [Verrucomicrobia bacterium]|nr:plastocyanin/azurin family copper-binding protein [Verrucomicrobiota bacterium]